MLGINDPAKRDPEPYRDYAAVNPGDPRFVELERAGWVTCYCATPETTYHWYRTTDEGRRLAVASFCRRRHPAKRRRYLRFLSVRDARPGLTFREFLTSPEFAEILAAA